MCHKLPSALSLIAPPAGREEHQRQEAFRPRRRLAFKVERREMRDEVEAEESVAPDFAPLNPGYLLGTNHVRTAACEVYSLRNFTA